MAEKLGWINFAGLRMAITSVRFELGFLVVVAEEPGPRRARTGTIELWGPDGITVCEGGWVTTSAVSEDEVLMMVLKMSIEIVGYVPPTVQAVVIGSQQEVR